MAVVERAWATGPTRCGIPAADVATDMVAGERGPVGAVTDRAVGGISDGHAVVEACGAER